MSVSQFRHAVVAGASMAGLLAARVLADHFNHVTLIRRMSSRVSPHRGKACRRDGMFTSC
jgi:flavin-dependent dehydrogenase